MSAQGTPEALLQQIKVENIDATGKAIRAAFVEAILRPENSKLLNEVIIEWLLFPRVSREDEDEIAAWFKKRDAASKAAAETPT